MTTHSQAFFEGLYEGVQKHASMEKEAEAFFDGIRQGINQSTHVSIMDKIAALVDVDGDDIEEVEEPQQKTASEIILEKIRTSA
jgi:hypothetical protein